MDIREKLLKNDRKIISIDDLAEILGIRMSELKDIYEQVEILVKDNLLSPVLNSGKNANINYPLYKKYRILVEEECSDEIITQINRLHPALLKSGYLSKHPGKYVENKEIIDKLNSYFFSRKGDEFVSRKERSFDIFRREKVLDGSGVKSLLNSLQISEEDLRFYDTPEYCFHDYIPVRKDNMTLLICENKDIWFNIRRCMFEDNYRKLFGVAIDGVVYGNGNKVSQKQGALSEYVKFMGNPKVTFLYWGDIDREGFDIFRRTKEVNGNLNILLFVPGYKKMIERAEKMENEDSPSSKKEGMIFEELIVDFTIKEKEFLKYVFENNKLIPQEIISYIHLSEEW